MIRLRRKEIDRHWGNIVDRSGVENATVKELLLRRDWESIKETAATGQLCDALAASDLLLSSRLNTHQMNEVLIIRINDYNTTESMVSETIAKHVIRRLFERPDDLAFSPNALMTIDSNQVLKKYFECLKRG